MEERDDIDDYLAFLAERAREEGMADQVAIAPEGGGEVGLLGLAGAATSVAKPRRTMTWRSCLWASLRRRP
jgi:hypothetical protein